MHHFFMGRTRTEILQRLRLRSRFSFETNALATRLYTGVPLYFAQSSDGQLFMANGIDKMLTWDGFRHQARHAGVPAPSGDAMTLTPWGIGEISGTYVAYQRWIDAEGNPSNLSVVSAETLVTNASRITYTNVEAPTDNRVARRQILRNTTGQQAVFYVDVDTEDLGNTTFNSELTDDQLETQPAVALFDEFGRSLADRFGEPPNHKPYLAHANDRMFAAGHVVYRDGHCEVTNGSATVTGRGTSWRGTFVNRRFAALGSREAYEILEVDDDAQTLTLSRPWLEASSKFTLYSIAPFPAERRLIYYTEPGLPHAWPATNAIAIEEDGDDITGLISLNTFVYVLEREHVRRFSFKNDPGLDGAAFPTLSRGCLHQRACVVVEGQAYIMDRKGIYLFTGMETAEPISVPVQDIFRFDGAGFRINWEAQAFFHAAHYPSQETVRFFVALSGKRYSRHALCFEYRQQRWSIEEYPFVVPSSTVAFMDVQRTLVGGDRANVLALETGPLDGPTVGSGTLRGQATSAGVLSLADSTAVFPSSGVVGSPIAIVEGRGKGQQRIISSVDGTTINLTQPWTIKPSTSGDDQSTYQIGAIPWRWKSGWMQYLMLEENNVRGVEILFGPMTVACAMDLRLYEDHALTPTEMAHDLDSDGVKITRGSADVVIDLETDNGYALLRTDSGGNENHVRTPDVVAIELEGFSSLESPVIHQVAAWGVAGEG